MRMFSGHCTYYVYSMCVQWCMYNILYDVCTIFLYLYIYFGILNINVLLSDCHKFSLIFYF